MRLSSWSRRDEDSLTASLHPQCLTARDPELFDGSQASSAIRAERSEFRGHERLAAVSPCGPLAGIIQVVAVQNLRLGAPQVGTGPVWPCLVMAPFGRRQEITPYVAVRIRQDMNVPPFSRTGRPYHGRSRVGDRRTSAVGSRVRKSSLRDYIQAGEEAGPGADQQYPAPGLPRSVQVSPPSGTTVQT